jgi:hypothetical protein
LSVLGHVIYLVQNDEFHTNVEHIVGFDELKNLITYDINTAFIGGIQMNHQVFVDGGIFGLKFVDKIDDRGGFARSRRAIKQEIGEIIFTKNVLEKFLVDRIENNVIKPCGSIFFNPRNGIILFFM